MLSFSILFYPIPCILPSVYPNPCVMCMYIYIVYYMYMYMYIHIRQMQPEVQCIMFFLCASSQRHVAKHRSTKPSHPAGLTSFGWWLLRSKLNNQIELDLPLCDKNHPKSSKKIHVFFSESIAASFRICFRMTTGIHPSMSRPMFRYIWMHHIFRQHLWSLQPRD